MITIQIYPSLLRQNGEYYHYQLSFRDVTILDLFEFTRLFRVSYLILFSRETRIDYSHFLPRLFQNLFSNS
jgi:hypothetical protein